MALILCLSAQATSLIRTHEEFVHMSDYEKNQIIIKTMELVVELESKYEHEVKTYGYNQERYEKFIRAISKIKSILFIDSAYAEINPPGSGGTGVNTRNRVPATRTPLVTTRDGRSIQSPSRKLPMTNWTDYGKSFVNLLNRPDTCVFAGWVSLPYVVKTPGKSPKTYCGHPDFILGEGANRHALQMAEFTKAYPDPKAGDSECGKDNRAKIQCNPAIFGYKTAADKSLFCVTASDGAHNSAYHCMKAALDETENQKGDKASDRLTFLRNNLTQNPAIFKGVQEFIYKTCVCDRKNGNFNRGYQEYMRPHRTCYGMVEMIASTVICKDDASKNLMPDTSLFEKIRQHMAGKITAASTEEDVQALYEPFVKNDLSKLPEYKVLCEGAPAIVPDVPVVAKEYACSSATCTTAPGAEGGLPVITCEFDVHTKDKTSEKATFEKPADVPEVGATGTFAINPVIDGKAVPLTCPLNLTSLPVVIAEKEYVCAGAKCTTTAAPEGSTTPVISCTYDIHIKDKANEKAVFTKDPTNLPAAGTTSGTLAFNGEIDGKPAALSCAYELTGLPVVQTDPDPVAKIYECKKAECSSVAAVAANPAISGSTATPASFTCSLEINEKDKTDKISKTATPDGTPENGKSSSFKVTLEKEEILSCPVTMKTTPVTPKIEPKAEPTPAARLSGPAPVNQGPPRPQMRGASDTSAVGIK